MSAKYSLGFFDRAAWPQAIKCLVSTKTVFGCKQSIWLTISLGGAWNGKGFQSCPVWVTCWMNLAEIILKKKSRKCRALYIVMGFFFYSIDIAFGFPGIDTGGLKSNHFVSKRRDEIYWKWCCCAADDCICIKVSGLKSQKMVRFAAAVIAAGSGSLLKPHWFWLSNGKQHNRRKPICQEKCRLDWTAWHGPAEWMPLPQTKQDTFECYLLRAKSAAPLCIWSDRGKRLAGDKRWTCGGDGIQSLLSQCISQQIKRSISHTFVDTEKILSTWLPHKATRFYHTNTPHRHRMTKQFHYGSLGTE